MLCLKRDGIVPQNHILDNEVSTVMKTIIRDECKMKMYWCRQVVVVAMQQRWPFEISRLTSSVYWWAQQKASHYHKPRSQSISSNSPIQHPTYHPTPISADHSIITR